MDHKESIVPDDGAGSVSPAGSPNGVRDAGSDVLPCTLWQLLAYFLRLGTFGFGGPIALAGHMQHDLVESRRWVTRQDYVEGLAFSQLSPGPLAAQLAMYLGWVRAGRLGASVVGLAFVLPSFLMVLALSALYVHYEGSLPWIQGLFYGMGAAVIAIIAISAYRLTRKTIGTDWLLWLLFAVAAVVTVWTEAEIIWVLLAGGIVAVLVRAPPRFRSRPVAFALGPWTEWLIAGLNGPASDADLWRIAWYFTEAGAFVFGSGLAIVPFLHGGTVDRFQWLNEQQFLDAVAVAMITPGPVVITVGFIGYLVAGPVGATLAALAIFFPCYFLVIVFAPYYRSFAQNEQIKTFVKGITATVIGSIAGAAIILGQRALFPHSSHVDLPAASIALTAFAVLLWTKRVPEPLVILAAGVIGLLLKQLEGA
jgi:chromate transporter